MRRAPWWSVAAVAVLVGVTVAGNFATGFRGRREPAATTIPAPSLAAQVQASALVIVGRVRSVARVGPVRDPGVVARVVVERVLAGPDPGGLVTVFDRGFVLTWQEGERGVYFLRPAGREDAPYRVAWRYLYRGRELDAPFTLAEITAAARRAATSADRDGPPGTRSTSSAR